MSIKQEKVYLDMFKQWDKMKADPSIILLESMSYDLNFYKIPKIFKRIVNDCFDKQQLHYSNLGGLPVLRDTIREYESLFNKNIKNSLLTIFIGNGTSDVFFNFMKAILLLKENTKRRKVLLFTPGYIFFDISIKHAGGIVKYVEGIQKDNFIPSIQKVKKAITSDVCAVVIASPNNPTGAAYTKEYLKELKKYTKKNKVFLISDEVYANMVKWPNVHHSIFAIDNSFSYVVKIFGPVKDRPGFSGIRTGYGIGDKRLEPIITSNYIGQSFAGNIISEYLLLYDLALRVYMVTGTRNKILDSVKPDEISDYKTTVLENNKKVFDLQEYVCEQFDQMQEKIEYIKPIGCNMVYFCFKNLNSYKFEKFGVWMYPGTYFNHPNKNKKAWTRICLTMDKEIVKEGLRRIAKFA